MKHRAPMHAPRPPRHAQPAPRTARRHHRPGVARVAALFAALALLAPGCYSPSTPDAVEVPAGFAESAHVGVDYAEAPGTYTKKYLIAAGDQFDIVVRGNEQASRRVVVRPDGVISLPIAGDVRAEGVTVPELRDELTRRLAERLVEPEVTVIALTVREPYVYVVGEVARPGPVPFRQARTAMQAVAFSGGLSLTAAPRAVGLIRLNEEGKLGAYTIPVAASGQPGPYLALQSTLLKPDDVVYVPASGIAQVNRAIREFVTEPLQGVNSILAPVANYLLIEELIEDDEF